MKLIIAGSRDLYFSPEQMYQFTKRANFYFRNVTEIVSGCARGIDRCGEQLARVHGKKVIHFPADWEKQGKRAGPIRNAEMADYADGALVIMHIHSRGSKDMVKRMLDLNKPVWVFTVKQQKGQT